MKIIMKKKISVPDRRIINVATDEELKVIKKRLLADVRLLFQLIELRAKRERATERELGKASTLISRLADDVGWERAEVLSHHGP